EAASNGMHHLAHDELVIRDRHAFLGLHRDLVLARAEFPEKRVRGDTRLPQRRKQRRAKSTLCTKAVYREGPASIGRFLLELELVFECAKQRQAGRLLKPRQCCLQDGAGAELPRLPVGVPDITYDELFLRFTFPEFHADPGGRIGYKNEIAQRSERALGDIVEAGDLHVGRRPPDAALQALVELRDRKSTRLNSSHVKIS